jgi:murein DD-endopeptidase MepM/ murein hydrolase activator NlpD
MDTNIPADETPLSCNNQPIQFGRSRLSRLLLSLKRRAGAGKTYSVSSSVAAVALVLSSITTNLSTSRSLADGLDAYVTPDPKVKVTLLASLDEYTPLVSEANDADGIVTAEVLPKDAVIQKIATNTVVTRAEQAAAVAAANPAPRPTSYVVKTGDTFSTIASRFDLTQDTLRVANLKKLTNVDSIKPGDSLSIPTGDYSDSYIDKQLAKVEAAEAAKKATATKLALASSKRSVAVRDLSETAGGVSFGRPAGATGKNGYHSWAVDIPPTGGLGVYASESGTVSEVATGWNGGYGNMIRISHGGGWETLYAHLASVSVEPGEKVSQGSTIGVMGATGRCIPKGAVHLHFEIRKNGTRLNPIQYIR